MAKNIQIVPSSGSLAFQDSEQSNDIIFERDGTDLLTKVGSSTVMTMDDSTVNFSNDINLIIPSKADSSDGIEGSLYYNGPAE